MIRGPLRVFRFFLLLYKVSQKKTEFDFLVFFQSPHLGGGHTFLKMITAFFTDTKQRVHFVFERQDFTGKVEQFTQENSLSYSLINPIEEVQCSSPIFSKRGFLFLYRFLIRSEEFLGQAYAYPAKKVIVNVGWPLSMFKAFFIPKPLIYFQHVLPRHDLDTGNLYMLRLFDKYRKVTFIGVSEVCSALIRKNWRIKKTKTLHHYNFPIPLQNILEPILDKNDGSIRIFTASRVEEGKNPELWLRVAKRITSQNPKIHFVWAGDGAFLEDMRTDSLGYERIHWLGEVQNVNHFYKTSDIYFEPSKREAFGLSMLEAMGFALPVVTTKCGGPEEFVEHGVTGFLSELDDENSLEQYLSVLISDNEMRKSMGQHGQELCNEKFTRELWTNKMEEILLIQEN